MEPFQPGGPAKNTEGRSLTRPPSDRYATLFSDGKSGKHDGNNDGRNDARSAPLSATRRSDRGARIATELRRFVFFGLILVAVAFAIVELISAF